MQKLTACIVGQANSGKSLFFNKLTNADQVTGNWSGVTVEKSECCLHFENLSILLVDLPGISSLNITSEDGVDEQQSLDFILNAKYDVVINFINVCYLKHALYLTTQLLEMQKPMIVLLNKIDRVKGILDSSKLAKFSSLVGCPTIPISAKYNQGMENAKQAIKKLALSGHNTKNFVSGYNFPLHLLIAEIQKDVRGEQNSQFLSIRRIESADQEDLKLVRSKSSYIFSNLLSENQRVQYKDFDPEIALIDSRYQLSDELCEVLDIKTEDSKTTLLNDSLDKVLLNKFLGIPILLFSLYLLLSLSFNLGSFLQQIISAICNICFGQLSRFIQDWRLFQIILEILNNTAQTVLGFVPIIAILYFCIAFLEESGYLPRAAFVMEKFFNKIKLPGKSLISIILGVGCNVPAILASRNLDKLEDRVAVALMLPFISCSARLTVFVMLASMLFPNNFQAVIFLLYLIGSVIGVITLLIAKKAFDYKFSADHFFCELPNYQLPSVRLLLKKSWNQARNFLLSTGKLIAIVSIMLHITMHINFSGDFTTEDQSILASSSKVLMPAFSHMGIGDESWPSVVALISGLFAKEAIVGTFYTLCSCAELTSVVQSEQNWLISMKEELSTIWQNFINHTILGVNLDNVTESHQFDCHLDLHFANSRVAFAYMIFVLLYFPCVSVFFTMAKEYSYFVAVASAIWSTVCAYSLSIFFYQASELVMLQTFSLTSVTIAFFVALITLLCLFYGIKSFSRKTVKFN